MKVSSRALAGIITLAAAFMAVPLGERTLAQTPPATLIPFNDFLQTISRAAPQSYLARPGSRVNGVSSFEAMRQHILRMYQGVTVRHSFLFGPDAVDCIPAMQQPAVRLLGLPAIAAEPPPLPSPSRSGPGGLPGGPIAIEIGQLGPERATDSVGNSQSCEDGEIPVRRITLDELTRFETLDQFFQKGPDGAGQPHPQGVAPIPAASHKYAHSLQQVTNIGGSSDLNLWEPSVNTNLIEVFSLSQQWYVAYTTPETPTYITTVGIAPESIAQTVEGGWQNYPQKYGSQVPRLFIYWTPDGYKPKLEGGRGCYNLDCAAFVQNSSYWVLGGPFQNYSVDGSAQYYVTLGYFLYNGAWWLNINGMWVGYYPATLYAGGPLASSAQVIDYGGETVGTIIWPPMGSGMPASAGWTHAAFQRNVYYVKDLTDAYYASLIAEQPSPRCYTDIPNMSSVSGWNTYFFFGGAGGSSC